MRGTLSAALVSSRQVRAMIKAGVDIGLALDWIVHADSGNFEHGGAMPGFTADAFFNPKADVAGDRPVERWARSGGVRRCPWASMSAPGWLASRRFRSRRSPSPPTGSMRSWIRLLTAYWLTMIASGVFSSSASP